MDVDKIKQNFMLNQTVEIIPLLEKTLNPVISVMMYIMPQLIGILMNL